MIKYGNIEKPCIILLWLTEVKTQWTMDKKNIVLFVIGSGLIITCYLNLNMYEDFVKPKITPRVVSNAGSQEVPREEHLSVIVFAHPRSGSSFAGELFNQNPQAFYLYEPLHDIHRRLIHPRPLNNTKYDELVVKIWENVLTCNFHKLSETLMRDQVLYRHSDSFQSHYHCLMGHDPYDTCIAQLEELCRSKPLRVFKTVRSTMEAAQQLLQRGVVDAQKLRLIHLMRDPRGHILSLRPNDALVTGQIRMGSVSSICARFVKDLRIQRQLQTNYPESFLELHYEDLSIKPAETVEMVYRFVTNSSAPKVVKDWLMLSTHNSNLTRELVYGTERRNAEETATKWMKILPPQVVESIDKVCSDFYHLSGFYKENFELN